VSASILDLNLLAEASPVNEGAVVSAPVAGLYYNLDIAWGWPHGHAGAALTTALSCAGATIDTGYGALYVGHTVGASGRRLFDMGWTPTGAVYLLDSECAAGYWRILFPTEGTYTLSLAGIGTQDIVVAGSAPAVTSPTITIIQRNPLNRQPSMLLQLAFNGTYPAGGLDLSEDQIGLYGVLKGTIDDTASYRLRWHANKLLVYDGSGEVSGSISFTVKALFIGTAG